jgi:hypothetical protein
LDQVEFSTALSKIEKKLILFGLGNNYLVGNRNLIEFTLTLKDITKLRILDESEAADVNANDDQFDNTTNLNIITDIIHEAKESKGKKVLNRKEVQAIELLQMNYNIL